MPRDLYYRVHVTGGGADYDLSPDVDSLRIEETSGEADQLAVQLSDPHKVTCYVIQEGMQVEVELGTVDDHSIVFRGMIYRTEGDFPQHGVPQVRLLAYDHSMEMGLAKRNRAHTEMSLKQLVETIGKEYFSPQNIKIELKGNPKFTGNGIRQQNETDLAFLLRLAKTYGCEMYAVAQEHDNELYFIAQQIMMDETPAITLYHGRCGVSQRLLSYRANASVSDIQLPRVFTGLDGEEGKKLEVETAEVKKIADPGEAFRDENLAEYMKRRTGRTFGMQQLAQGVGKVRDDLRERLGSVQIEPTIGFVTQEDLRIRAENQFSTSLNGMRGSGVTEGNHRIMAQTTINIGDVGERFSKKWYLSEVRHILDKDGYRTEFDCQR